MSEPASFFAPKVSSEVGSGLASTDEVPGALGWASNSDFDFGLCLEFLSARGGASSGAKSTRAFPQPARPRGG